LAERKHRNQLSDYFKFHIIIEQMDKSQKEQHPSQEFAIHTQGLSRRYGEVEALVDLNLSVPYGSIFGYLGRNGAGKTTLARLLLRLYDVQSDNDSIRIDGINIKDLKFSKNGGWVRSLRRDSRKKLRFIGGEGILSRRGGKRSKIKGKGQKDGRKSVLFWAETAG